MKLNITIIVIVFLVFSGINFVFAQKTASVALVFLRPDKEIYFPGDSVFIHGQDNMNVTSITIELEKDHNVMVSSEDSQVLKNGTFYANFTLPRDSDAKYWSLVSGPLHQDLYFKPVYLSPLKQFKSGIAAKDVQCKEGLQFIMKNENGQPACVTPRTFDELITRGWGIIPLGGLPTYHNTSNSTGTIVNTTETECENVFKPKEFQTGVFPNGTSYTVTYVPVFLLKPNSTGKICINNWSYDKSHDWAGKTFEEPWQYCQGAYSCIQVTPSPQNITVNNVANTTIVYTISSSGDQKGLFEVSPLFYDCTGLPVAVGYDSSHSFDNDFPWLWKTVPCYFSGIHTEIIGTTGIDTTYIAKYYH